MSKAKLIELIKMDDADLNFWLEDVSTKDARELFRQALKEQDRDTRHGCAEACENAITADHLCLIGSVFSEVCINYQNKDLEGL